MKTPFKHIFRIGLLSGSLLCVNACTMEHIGKAIATVEKIQAPHFYSNRLPLRMPVILHEKGTQQSEIFHVNQDSELQAHLVFHEPDWAKSPENQRLYENLGNIMLKFNNHQDFPQFNPQLAPSEMIQAKVSVQNVDTGQIVAIHQIDLKGIMQEQYIAFHSYALQEMAIKISHEQPEKVLFRLPKGRYRLIFENQNASTAYQPYQPRLQLAPQLPNWFN